jgi:hypothetical protein
MDNEDIESTLHALRKLYGLLGKDGDTSLDFTSNAVFLLILGLFSCLSEPYISFI